MSIDRRYIDLEWIQMLYTADGIEAVKDLLFKKVSQRIFMDKESTQIYELLCVGDEAQVINMLTNLQEQ